MIEKVNPSHPDKVADRIAGALVDLAYSKVENPRIAVEVLLGHGVINPNRSLEKASCHFLMTAIRKTALYMLDS